MTATHELVVPKSIPMIFPMIVLSQLDGLPVILLPLLNDYTKGEFAAEYDILTGNVENPVF
jgi:hypothetical protein